ncbi:DHH family phosphoesterase [Cohnella thailandensis]|uniref:Cyclic-di-AMP phosphodiesterase n=1 Tax=Cohnella thailandensis TaxID=557557 RepID=A0A841SW31_9BACL|nr:DHH family phosphoesterase [Cohnella thailandensis]MBB6634070.1 DHH family phosphoesterase [Cohnella thailandensis]MBP1972438.1 c-di-AMP phosphodiesterase-like protein [Cohnella thailandensis]
MPKFLVQRWHGMHIVWAMVLVLLLTVALAWYEWVLGLIGLLLGGAIGVYSILAERAFRKDLNDYVLTLSHRIKGVANDVIGTLPFGIIVYNEDKEVQWHNSYISALIGRSTVIGVSLAELFPGVTVPAKEKDASKLETTLNGRIYELLFRQQERMLYVKDVTEHWTLAKKYEDEKLALGIVMLDNLEEVAQGMDEQQRAIMLSKVAGEITEWANKYGLFLRRLSSDKYMVVTNQLALKQLEQSRFELLDEVRELTMNLKLPLTLSIGFASGSDSVVELGQLSQGSLDIALGRGGDQAVVKFGQRQSFYGGKSNAVEKRTRVRARVISHALRDLMKESENIIVMGHKMPDMDAIGAAIGVVKAAQQFGKEAFIVLEGINPAIQKMMDMLREDEKLYRRFISPEQALGMTSKRSLAVVVDTHRASMVAEPRLLQLTDRIVLVDHHRRSEEFIDDAVLVYMEPYASSTCELVTELLQYIHERVVLDLREATALLAGITVDTKNFALRTGSRTFEAASFLRRNGADPILIQRMLKEDLEEYIKKAEIIQHAEMYREHIAIAVADTGKPIPQLLIAQAADTLLNMTGIKASFVIGMRPDGQVGISARSLGQINVQVVMERLGGGGHLSNAACQMQGKTVQEVAATLKQVLKEFEGKEGILE